MNKKEIVSWLNDNGIKINVKTAQRIFKENYEAYLRNELTDDEVLDKIKSDCIKAEANAKKFKHHRPIYLQVPNTYIIRECISFYLANHSIFENALTDQEFSHVIENFNDEFTECLKIDRENGFNGFSYTEFFIMSALFSFFTDNNKNIKADGDYRTLEISLADVFGVLYPNKRWNSITFAVKNTLHGHILALGRALKKVTGKYFNKFGRLEIEDGWGDMFMRIDCLDNSNADNAKYKIRIDIHKSLLVKAKKQKQVVGIAPAYLSFPYYNKGNNHLAVWYMAYRVNIHSKTMINTISIDTLDKVCGKVSRPLIKRYFKFLYNEALIGEYQVSRIKITWEDAPKHQEKPLIVLHDAQGKEVHTELTDEVKETAQKIKSYNEYINKQDLRCNGRKIYADLHAVYNQDWNHGGRLYGEHQQINADDRANITINGNPTIELDYSALHPNMLYAMQGIQLQEDPYAFIANDRPLAKKVLNILINANDEDSAIGAVKAYIKENKLNEDAYNCIMLAKNQHSGIKQFFHSGIGLQLQNKDGKIALHIIKALQGMKIPCLPVHDSFIVPEDKAKALEQTMLKVYQDFNAGCNIGIKSNKGLFLLKSIAQTINQNLF